MLKTMRIMTLSSALLCSSLALAAAPTVGSRAELFTLKVVNVDTVDKRVYSLAKVVGPSVTNKKKLVILSFFATYCEPCKRELPFLQELYRRYADKGLEILVVSIDKDKDVKGGAAKAIGDLAAKHGVTYPVLHDRFNIVAKRYGIEKLPSLYLIDGEGHIALANVGYTNDFSSTLAKEVQTRLGVKVEPIEHAQGKHK